MVKSARFERLLASTSVALVLALSAQASMAQQSDKSIEAAVPMPDTTLPAPLTLKDIQRPAKDTTNTGVSEAQQNITSPAADPVKAAASTPAAEVTLADKLREFIGGRQFDRMVPRKAERAGIESFYAARNYAPLWISNNGPNERASSATAYLRQADNVGLDPNDYPSPDFKSAGNLDSLAEDEIRLTASALTFARHAQIGRIHFTRVAADIQYELNAPDPAAVLGKLADEEHRIGAVHGEGDERAVGIAGRILADRAERARADVRKQRTRAFAVRGRRHVGVEEQLLGFVVRSYVCVVLHCSSPRLDCSPFSGQSQRCGGRRTCARCL